ncbi:MAG: thioredoxin family protein [Nanoarchaeota archaeon]
MDEKSKARKPLFYLGSNDDVRVAIDSGKKVFVYSFAKWCSPCQWSTQMFEEHAPEIKDLLTRAGIEHILRVNYSDNMDNSDAFPDDQPKAIPNWRVYSQGSILAEGTINVQYMHFKKRLEQLISPQLALA